MEFAFDAFIGLGVLYLCSAFLVLLDWLSLFVNKRHLIDTLYRVIEVIMALFTIVALWLSKDILSFPFTGRTILSQVGFRSVYILTGMVIIIYFYCIYHRAVATPVLEVLINGGLIAGIGLGILLSVIFASIAVWMFCILPVWLLILALVRNHRRLPVWEAEEGMSGEGPVGGRMLERFCRDLLNLRPAYKYPLLSVIGGGIGSLAYLLSILHVS